MVISHLCAVSLSSMFSINQPLNLQKTKPLFPNPKYLFAIGISHRVSLVCGDYHQAVLKTCKVQALKTTNMVSLCLCKFHVFCLLWQGLQFRQTIVLCLPGRSVRIHNYPCLYQFSTLGCFKIFISYTQCCISLGRCCLELETRIIIKILTHTC